MGRVVRYAEYEDRYVPSYMPGENLLAGGVTWISLEPANYRDCRSCRRRLEISLGSSLGVVKREPQDVETYYLGERLELSQEKNSKPVTL